MSNVLEISPTLRIPEYELIFSFARSSGKGGQNVNKVNSKAILMWSPSASRFLPWDVKTRFLQKYANQISNEGLLVIQSDRYRDQPMNMKDCIEKLRDMLITVEFAPKKRKKTKPTYSSKIKRLDSKKVHSQKKKLRQRVD